MNNRQFISETLDAFIKDRKYKYLIFNHLLGESLLYSILEDAGDSIKRKDVLNKISNGEWESPQNPENFYQSIQLSKHKEMLSSFSTQELSEMRLFKVVGYNIGFALKLRDGKFNEIVAVHNNEPEVKNIGKELVKAAIKNGGCYLDHFDGYLTPFYKSLGFDEVGRDKFDPTYDADNSFRNKYGEMDVIYRKYKNCK